MTLRRETEKGYRFRQDGKNGNRQLGPTVEDVRPWQERDLLSSRFPGQNLVALGAGTPVKLWAYGEQLVYEQLLEGTALRRIAGGSPTDGDLDGFDGGQGEWVEVKNGRHYVEHRPQTVVDVRKLGDSGGNGADPLRAIESLDVDPDVVDTLDEVVEEAVGGLQDDGHVNATLAEVRGYGGTYPQQDYAEMKFVDTIRTTRIDRFHLVPPKKEPLHRKNARGELALVLANPPARDRWEGFVIQQGSGPQPTDASLMSGILSVTGNGGAHCSFDAETIHSMLKMHGSYVVAHPCQVVVPVKTMGTRWWSFRNERQVEYEAPVRNIVGEVREVVRAAPDDFYVATICGMFWDKEVEQLKRQCEALGNVHVRVNLMQPKLSADRRFAHFLVCMFAVPQYAPWELVELLAPEARERYRHGVTWDELQEIAVGVPEMEMAFLIRDELKRIRAARRR